MAVAVVVVVGSCESRAYAVAAAVAGQANCMNHEVSSAMGHGVWGATGIYDLLFSGHQRAHCSLLTHCNIEYRDCLLQREYGVSELRNGGENSARAAAGHVRRRSGGGAATALPCSALLWLSSPLLSSCRLPLAIQDISTDTHIAPSYTTYHTTYIYYNTTQTKCYRHSPTPV